MMSAPTVSLESPDLRFPVKDAVAGALPVLGMVFSSAAIAGFALLCEWPLATKRPLFGVFPVLASTLLFLVGYQLVKNPDRRTLGLTMLLCSPLWASQLLNSWDVGILPIASGFATQLFYMVGGTGLLFYPADLPRDRLDRTLIFLLFGVTSTTQLLMTISYAPTEFGFAPQVWWYESPTLHAISGPIIFVSVTTAIAIELLFNICLIRRVLRMSHMDRLVAIPVAVAAGAAGAVSNGAGKSDFFPTLNIYFLIESIFVLGVPLSMFVVSRWQERQQADIAFKLTQTFAVGPITVERVRSALRSALRDEELDVLYWSPELDAYIGEKGITRDTQNPSDGSFIQLVKTQQGEPLAAICGDASLWRHPRTVNLAISASTVALENARLHAELLNHIDDVKRSRGRIAEAAIDERRRIERDLHDGVQQRLLALVTRLGTARRDNEKGASLDWITSSLLSAIEDVRNLGQGIHPAELRQFGIKSAIETLAADVPLAITIDADDTRYSSVIEGTVYFVVCEALNNSVKHFGATGVHVNMRRLAGSLIASVADNGHGGANLASGRGLTGMRDRVNAIGGVIQVESGSEIGTTITLRMPCS